MIPSQMLKGILEGCILAITEKSELYGYEISQKLTAYGFGKISEGTIYPLLLRLQKNGLISSEMRESQLGPKRKYYTLTDEGRRELADFMENYRNMTDAVEKLLKETGDGNEQKNKSSDK